MRFSAKSNKMVAWWMIFCFASVSVCLSPAYARMISTEHLANPPGPSSPERSRIDAFLDREDIRTHLVSWGMNAEMVQARLNGLTDEEIARMARQIDRLPAGGSAVGTIVGAAVLVFLVLLVTDILGFTNVFPFTRSVR